MSSSIITDEEIDEALMTNITNQWRKVARVVGTTMGQIDVNRRAELMDSYFAKRVAVLVEKGLIEYEGDLDQMRHCEVRILQKAIDD